MGAGRARREAQVPCMRGCCWACAAAKAPHHCAYGVAPPALLAPTALVPTAAGTNGVEVKAGRGGLPTVHLKSAAGATVEVGRLEGVHN